MKVVISEYYHLPVAKHVSDKVKVTEVLPVSFFQKKTEDYFPPERISERENLFGKEFIFDFPNKSSLCMAFDNAVVERELETELEESIAASYEDWKEKYCNGMAFEKYDALCENREYFLQKVDRVLSENPVAAVKEGFTLEELNRIKENFPGKEFAVFADVLFPEFLFRREGVFEKFVQETEGEKFFVQEPHLIATKVFVFEDFLILQ